MFFDVMTMSLLILTLIGFFVVIALFHYYGAFILPLYISLPLISSIILVLIHTVSLLPYNISLYFFNAKGDVSQETVDKIKRLYTYVYWVSWSFSWIITPVMVFIYSFRFALTPFKRVWNSIVYNFVWYLLAMFVFSGFVVLMLATDQFYVRDIVPLIMRLSNLYGLLLLSFLLGHGFVSLPKHLWIYADLNKRIHKYTNEMKKEIHRVAEASLNARIAVGECKKGLDLIHDKLSDAYRSNITYRIIKMENLLSQTTFLLSSDMIDLKEMAEIDVLKNINWRSASIADIENFIRIVDNAILDLEMNINFLMYSSDAMAKCTEKKKHEKHPILGFIFRRSIALFVSLFSLASIWGQYTITLQMGDYSLFTKLSKLKVPVLVGEFFITAPILFMTCLYGIFSLLKLRLGNYYRFVKGGTSDTTFYYFVVGLSRLAPTVGYNHLMQIDQENKTPITQIWNDNSRYKSLDRYCPTIIITFVGLLVLFDVYNIVMNYFGQEKLTFKKDDGYHNVSSDVISPIDNLQSKAILSQSKNIDSTPLLF